MAGSARPDAPRHCAARRPRSRLLGLWAMSRTAAFPILGAAPSIGIIRTIRPLRGRISAVFFGAWLFGTQPALALGVVASFGTTPGENPGNLVMLEHVPAGATTPMPLVLVLHGCSQDRGYAAAAGLIALADDLGFGVIVAETATANSAASTGLRPGTTAQALASRPRCWRWWPASGPATTSILLASLSRV